MVDPDNMSLWISENQIGVVPEYPRYIRDKIYHSTVNINVWIRIYMQQQEEVNSNQSLRRNHCINF